MKTRAYCAGLWLGALVACRTSGPASPTHADARQPTSVGATSFASSTPSPPQPGSAQAQPASAPAAPERGCDSASDCEIAWLLLDCCGSVHATGVTKGARAAAEQAAQRKQLAGSCECLASPTRLDSDQNADTANEVAVVCDSRVCVTRLAEKRDASALAPSPKSPAAPVVACRSDDDCWVSGYPERPVARPKNVHHRFRGCVDGEVPPLCDRGVCALGLRYRC
jgi:hypothetical protein